MTLAASIAYNRFGLGATPQGSSTEPRTWLLQQITTYRPALPSPNVVGNSAAMLGQFLDYRTARDAARKAGQLDQFNQDKTHTEFLRQAGINQGAQRITSALTTPTPFAERLVHFWSNHFAISAEKQEVRPIVGLFEFEAIRPNVMRGFADLWMAVMQHSAMLLYLDQAQSIGPNSPLANLARGRKLGLNENLAREAMELHSLGVRSGYTQADVTELARALTGWTVGGMGRGIPPKLRPGRETPGWFLFAPALHEPGERTVLGRYYLAGGEGQARAILLDLVKRPETAKHIATKLATHFVGDTPPPSLVARVAAAFYQTAGDLPTTYRALIEAPEAWAPAATKFKSPWDWAISAMRGLGIAQADQRAVGMMNQLGQPIWQPGSPAGWADTIGAWAGPDALLRRVEVAQNLVNFAPPMLDARALAPRLIGQVGAATARMIAGADSPRQALVLMLASPEFQRR